MSCLTEVSVHAGCPQYFCTCARRRILGKGGDGEEVSNQREREESGRNDDPIRACLGGCSLHQAPVPTPHYPLIVPCTMYLSIKGSTQRLGQKPQDPITSQIPSFGSNIQPNPICGLETISFLNHSRSFDYF